MFLAPNTYASGEGMGKDAGHEGPLQGPTGVTASEGISVGRM